MMMNALDDTSSTTSASTGGGGADDLLFTPNGRRQRPKGLVRSAARRMQLAWQSARTHAKAQQTLQQYEATSTPSSRQGSSLSSSLRTLASSPWEQQRSPQQQLQRFDAARTPINSRTPSRAQTPLIPSDVCQSVDEALVSLYSDTGLVASSSSTSSTPSRRGRQYMSASFHLPLEYDTLLDAEHPFAMPQDLQDSEYWMQQWDSTQSQRHNQQQKEHADDKDNSSTSLYYSQWEASLQEMLQQPQHRPLLPLIHQQESSQPRALECFDEKKEASIADPQKEEEDDDFGDFQSAFSDMQSPTGSPPLVIRAHTTSHTGASKGAQSEEEDGDDVWHTPQTENNDGSKSRLPQADDNGDAVSPKATIVQLPPLSDKKGSSQPQMIYPSSSASTKTTNTEMLIYYADEILKDAPVVPTPSNQEGGLSTPDLVNLTQSYLHQQERSQAKAVPPIQHFPPVSPPQSPPTSSTLANNQTMAIPTNISTTPRSIMPDPTRSSPTKGMNEFSFSPSSAFQRTPRRLDEDHADSDDKRKTPLSETARGLSPAIFLPANIGSEKNNLHVHAVHSTSLFTQKTPEPRPSPKEESPPKPSLTLPIEDLTTVEGRWTRRRQLELKKQTKDWPVNDTVENDKDDHVGEASDSEYLPSRDETVQVLNSLPWEYVMGLTEEHDGPNGRPTSPLDLQSELDIWDEVMTDRLCTYDSKLLTVQKDMTQKVDAQQVESVNELIHEWDTNLRVANVYFDRAEEALCNAVQRKSLDDKFEIDPEIDEGEGFLGQLLLLDLWESREKYDSLNLLLNQLHSMFQIEQEIIERIDNFDVRRTSAMEEYKRVRVLADKVKTIASGPLSSVSCVSETIERLATLGDRFWDRIHFLLGSLVTRLCRERPDQSNSKHFASVAKGEVLVGNRSDWMEYRRLIRAAMDLEHVEKVDDHIFAKSWTKIIFDALSYEALRSFALALLDPPGRNTSQYDNDLIQLSLEIRDWGDVAKLKQSCHNLVTIRFHFEATEFYFPRVYQSLCQGLAQVLQIAKRIEGYHIKLANKERCGMDDADHARLKVLSTEIAQSLSLLWEQCESVLIQCLDEYIHFSGKRELFCRSSDSDLDWEINDTEWILDLAGLNSVHNSTEEFLKHKEWFLCETKSTTLISMLSSGETSKLYERFETILHNHMHSVHVEILRTGGKSLSQETWLLSEVPLSKCAAEDSFDEGSGVKESLHLMIIDNLHDYEKRLSQARDDTGLRAYSNDQAWSSCMDPNTSESPHSAMELLVKMTSEENQRIIPINMVKSAIPWLSRLILISDKLPLMVAEIEGVVTNMFNLYTSTVFRMICGNLKNEMILIGDDKPPPLSLKYDEPTVDNRPSSPSIFGGNLWQAKPSRPEILIPPLREVEICAPLLKYEERLKPLRRFITEAREGLTFVKLERVDGWLKDPEIPKSDSEEVICLLSKAFEKRVAAAWSCVVLVCLGHISEYLISKRLAEYADPSLIRHLFLLREYLSSIDEIMPSLLDCSLQYACIKAISGRDIVTKIIGVGPSWEKSMLHEYPNDYVEELSERCCLIWGYVAASGKLPASFMELCWKGIANAAYQSMLEGFSRVPFCSTEGRALMALDLASFTAGISRMSLVELLENHNLTADAPSCSVHHLMRVVDTYIKVFYYPHEEIVRWINENYEDYKMTCSMALVVSEDTSDSFPKQKVQQLLDDIKALYDE